ncbi:MAG TPA: hypothetical protein VI316_01340 [Candidatus Dormibacteraeota bacterium]
MVRPLALTAVAAGLLGCSSGASAGTSLAAEPLRSAPPAAYLLQLDDLPLPGFTVDSPPAPVAVDGLAGGDQLRAARLRADHFAAAAQARYFRPTADFANSNGPVDVISTVERFASVSGAGDAFLAETQHQDSAAGSTPLATGPLGDQAHGVLVTADANGIPVARTVLVWRTANLVSILEVHERLAGSPLAHALAVAAPQVARQGGATPLPQ